MECDPTCPHIRRRWDGRGGDRRTDRQRQTAQERAAQMAALRAQGWTLEQIGGEFGVTRQRVHAILTARPDPQRTGDRNEQRESA